MVKRCSFVHIHNEIGGKHLIFKFKFQNKYINTKNLTIDKIIKKFTEESLNDNGFLELFYTPI